MAYELSIDRETGIATVVVTGVLTLDESVRAIDEYYRAADYRQRILWDLRDADLSKITSDAMVHIQRHLKRRRPQEWPPGKTAYLVDNDLQFGVARASESWYGDLPWATKVIRGERAEALAWLREPTSESKEGE